MPLPKQPYIPGLTQRPPDHEFPQPEPEMDEDDILLKDFLGNRKNPTMCLHEYCQRNKLKLDFKEEDAEYRPGLISRYGFRVYIDGMKYQQGVGGNKKEAKNDASRLAFRACFGLDNFEPEAVHELNEGADIHEVKRLKDICLTLERGEPIVEVKQNDEKLYVCNILVGGLEQIIERRPYKEEAIIAAHSRAIRLLGFETTSDVGVLNEPSSFPALCVTDTLWPDPELACQRQEKAYAALSTHLANFPAILQKDHHLAAFFICSKGQDPVGELVAFGTGNSSIDAANLAMDGRCLLDSSCVTVARRSLRRYLANQMVSYFKRQTSIFTAADDGTGKLKLSEGKTLHLYLSHPPDGDYQDFIDRPSTFTPEDEDAISRGGHIPNFTEGHHGMLKCRSEGAFELTENTPDQTSFATVQQSNELRLMSQSDKLLKWNILGLQGAKFSLFTHPVYLSSIAIGRHANQDHGHLSRAVCCRVYEELDALLAPGYSINHPVLHFCSRGIKKLSQLYPIPTNQSINWNWPDLNIEILDGETGKTNEISPFRVSQAAKPASRLCKAAMHLKWFKDLCKAEGRGKDVKFEGKSSAEAKETAEEYQKSKEAFYSSCLEWKIGKWVHAPPELDKFTK